MQRLRDKMREDLALRGMSAGTIVTYVGCARRFAEHFGRSPSRMGAAEVREFLLHLAGGVRPNTFNGYVSALRFLYDVTLARPEDGATLPRMRVPMHLPTVLTGVEVEQVLDALASDKHRAVVMLAYGAGLRISEACSPGSRSSRSSTPSRATSTARGDARVRSGGSDQRRACAHMATYSCRVARCARSSGPRCATSSDAGPPCSAATSTCARHAATRSRLTTRAAIGTAPSASRSRRHDDRQAARAALAGALLPCCFHAARRAARRREALARASLRHDALGKRVADPPRARPRPETSRRRARRHDGAPHVDARAPLPSARARHRHRRRALER